MFEEKIKHLGGLAPVRSDDFNGLSAKEIQQIEDKIESSLPDDYKAFLAQYGTVLFNKSVGFKPIEQNAVYPHNDETGLPNPPFNGSQVSVFFGKDAAEPADSLSSKLEVYKDRMPNSVIPIADDGLGNKICLNVGKEDKGKIYWWDHENEWDEEDYEEETGTKMPEEAKYQNIYLVAESFSDFIEKLHIVAE